MEHRPVSVAEARLARERIEGIAVRTPLVRLEYGDRHDIYLKLENLQPIGSFKIRGAAAKVLMEASTGAIESVWTASAGNMAQGAAWCARHLGVPFTAIVPEHAPMAKTAAIERLGGQIVRVSREQFFEVFSTRSYPNMTGLFVHAFSDPDVMAGNATIALEILEDLPGVKQVYVPYGGGGLSCGIGSVLRALSPETEVIACEPETAAPFAASRAAGEPTAITFQPSFVDGAGGPYVYPEMLKLAEQVIDRAAPVSLPATAEAIRILVERVHIVAEGAGALGLAAALAGEADGPVVCVISGGNIDTNTLRTALGGVVPDA